MKVKASISVKYPTVSYGNADLALEVEADTNEFDWGPERVTQEYKNRFVADFVRFTIQREWAKLRDEVEAQLVNRFVSIMPPQMEADLIRQGKVNRNGR